MRGDTRPPAPMIVEDTLRGLGLDLPDPERDYRTNASGARYISHVAVHNVLYVSERAR